MDADERVDLVARLFAAMTATRRIRPRRSTKLVSEGPTARCSSSSRSGFGRGWPGPCASMSVAPPCWIPISLSHSPTHEAGLRHPAKVLSGTESAQRIGS